MRRLLCQIALLLVLAGCGQKGPLFMPRDAAPVATPPVTAPAVANPPVSNPTDPAPAATVPAKQPAAASVTDQAAAREAEHHAA